MLNFYLFIFYIFGHFAFIDRTGKILKVDRGENAAKDMSRTQTHVAEKLSANMVSVLAP